MAEANLPHAKRQFKTIGHRFQDEIYKRGS